MAYGYPQQFTQPMSGGYGNYKATQQYTVPGSWNPIQQVRPVASLEEVKASPIEFDGSVFYFPDITNKKIYTKFINLDGTVAINMYELKELSADQSTGSNFVTRQEFESVIEQLKTMLDAKTPEVAAAQPNTIYQF